MQTRRYEVELCVILPFYLFIISQHINIVLKSKHDLLQVTVQKLRFINQNLKGIWILLPLVFIYFGNCSDMYLLHLAKNVYAMRPGTVQW